MKGTERSGPDKGASLVILRTGYGMPLVIERRSGVKKHPAFYKFIAGHIEPHQSPLEAAIAELSEEGGIEVAPEDLHLIFSEDRPNRDGPGTHKRYVFAGDVGKVRVWRSESGIVRVFRPFATVEQFAAQPDLLPDHRRLLMVPEVQTALKSIFKT